MNFYVYLCVKLRIEGVDDFLVFGVLNDVWMNVCLNVCRIDETVRVVRGKRRR